MLYNELDVDKPTSKNGMAIRACTHFDATNSKEMTGKLQKQANTNSKACIPTEWDQGPRP